MTALPASLDLLSMEHAAAPESAEQQKIRAAQAGDMAAFEWLVQQHEERLLAFCCRWLRSPEDAREVCQDAFVRAFKANSVPDLRNVSARRSWLRKIAHNL